jgi:N-acetylglucosamine-6-sulfatase
MLSSEGHEFVETPSLDRLAAEGVRFTNAFVTTSLCSPSRGSFLTGLYPERHGVFNNFTPWNNENRTFFEYLKRVGYRTGFVGKWHMPGGLPSLRGVDHFVTFTVMGGQGVYFDCPLVVNGVEEPSRKPYIAEELTDRALEFIRAHREEPFVLYLSHKNVHAPFSPDPREQGRYAQEPFEIPDEAHSWVSMTEGQYVHLTLSPLQTVARRYAEAVTSMDREIGRVLDTLDELGLADRTAVLYTSDNGYLFGEHGLIDKRWAYEESIRVPFLFRYPPLQPTRGTEIDRAVLNVDLAPTLLGLAGVEVPQYMQGRSLLPLLRDPKSPWRDAFYYSYPFEPHTNLVGKPEGEQLQARFRERLHELRARTGSMK